MAPCGCAGFVGSPSASALFAPPAATRSRLKYAPPTKCFAHKQTAPDAGIRGLPTPNLFLLTAGGSDPQVMQALSRDAMEPLLKHFRDEFELIVIDSSPVLPLAHAMRISKHVDAAVLAIMNADFRGP